MLEPDADELDQVARADSRCESVRRSMRPAVTLPMRMLIDLGAVFVGVEAASRLAEGLAQAVARIGPHRHVVPMVSARG